MLKQIELLCDQLNDGVYVVDKDRKILYFNPAAERISGFSRSEVVGSYCYDNILNHVDEEGTRLCLAGCPLHDTILTSKTNHAEVYLHHKDGYRVKVAVTTIPHAVAGKNDFAIEIFNDLSEVNELKKEVMKQRHLTLVDDLTKMLNRKYLHQLTNAPTKKKILNAILFVDIDNFGIINKNHGHEVGDKTLKMVASTIMNSIKASDAAIRYGGEEFVVILKDISKKEALKVAEKMRMLIASSAIRMDKEKISVTASIGVGYYLEGENVQEAIKKADLAMLRAKSDGKNRVVECVL